MQRAEDARRDDHAGGAAARGHSELKASLPLEREPWLKAKRSYIAPLAVLVTLSQRSIIMMRKLTRKIALVTGGSRSIGAAMAKRLAADSADLQRIARQDRCSHPRH